MKSISPRNHGFTLVELSIVMVIIGLVIGGIVIGRNLIKASEIRAQVSQIEQIRMAVNAFKLKYNGLPADILASQASAYGLFAMSGGGAQTRGDANGLLESGGSGCHSAGLSACFYAELTVFWRHLSEAQFIDGSYLSTTYAGTHGQFLANATTPDVIGTFFPRSKLDKNAYLIVNSYLGINYMTLVALNSINGTSGYSTFPSDPLYAADAYEIDSKIDDGMPNTGTINALRLALGNNQHSSAMRTLSTNSNCVSGGNYVRTNVSTSACSLSFRF